MQRGLVITLLLTGTAAGFTQAVARKQQTDFLNLSNQSANRFNAPPANPDLFPQRANVIPANVADRFSEGIFTAKEQVHDSQIADLISRVSGLEGTSNWVKGAVWAIGLFLLATTAFLKAFWKGIIKVILAEAPPPIWKP